MLPVDSITISSHIVGGITSSTILSVPSNQTYTILHLHLDKTGGASNSMDDIQTSSGTYLDHVQSGQTSDSDVNFKVQGSSSIYFVTEGSASDHHFMSMTYVPYDTATDTPIISRIDQYSPILVTLGIIIGALLLLDLLRRLFSPHTR